MYIYTQYIHTYIHTYIHICIHACIHTYIHTYIHTIHTYIHNMLPTYTVVWNDSRRRHSKQPFVQAPGTKQQAVF